MNNNLVIDKARSSQLLREWREQLSIGVEAAADALGVGHDEYRLYELGGLDLPVTVWRKCVALRNGEAPDQQVVSLSRDRWVRMVENAIASLTDEHHISRLIQGEQWEEVADFMDFMKSGPHHDLALTDPYLYRKLREAGTRAALSGLMHFKGPTRPFPETSFRLDHRVSPPDDPSPNKPR